MTIIIPDIASALVSEVAILDNHFGHVASLPFGRTNLNEVPNISGPAHHLVEFFFCFGEKFSLGFINSLFIWLPTSVSHVILLRRFAIQGISAGYIAGMGIIAGNILWFSSILFGWRFFVIPWLSLDSFRYFFGFILLIKYLWDSQNETAENRLITSHASVEVGAIGSLQSQKGIRAAPSVPKQKPDLGSEQQWKIFSLSFLLVLTEQTSIYPFISNITVGVGATGFETFPVSNYFDFIFIHGSYIFGLLVGCLSLLFFTCWFWQPFGVGQLSLRSKAEKIYMWLALPTGYPQRDTAPLSL